MADKNIHEGDDVQWNWGSGHPKGTVAEIKEDGQLEIESKGKNVHKNASPENPAVHVARDGNDVVKRMSELEKIGDGETATDAKDEPKSVDAPKKKKETSPKTIQAAKRTLKTSNRRAGAEKKGKVEVESTKEGTEPEVGEKRERSSTEEDVETGTAQEQEKAEKDTGKMAKKAKTSGSNSEDHAREKPVSTKGRKTKGAAKPKTLTATGTTKKRGRAAKKVSAETVEDDEDDQVEEMEDVQPATVKAKN